jgi:hypothetical protein
MWYGTIHLATPVPQVITVPPRRALFPVLGLVLASAVEPALAQDLAEVRLDRAGTIVRVYTAPTLEPPIEGNVRRLGPDGLLVIGTDMGYDIDVPRATIERIEFSTGRRGHPWWGAVAGAFVMGIPGAIYWSRECEGGCRVPALEGFALGALYFGVVPGFVIGSLIRTRDWRVLPLVYLDSAVGRRAGTVFDVRLAPTAGGGLSLGVRLSLGARPSQEARRSSPPR